MLSQYLAAISYARTCAVVYGNLDAVYLPVLKSSKDKFSPTSLGWEVR